MKFYYIIYLLEYIGKILEKVIANELSRIYEKKSLLYSDKWVPERIKA